MSVSSGLLVAKASSVRVATARERFRRDIMAGLRDHPKQLPSKYFYNRRGSELFDRICELPEYYPARTENGIMRDHADEMAERIGPSAMVIELGSGSGLKTGWLLTHLPRPAAYVPVDISRTHLFESAERTAGEFTDIEVCPLHADFSQPIIPPLCQTPVERRVVYFPGSTIGNFKPAAAKALLRRIRDLVGDDGGLLVGFDLVKDHLVLEAAYNDTRQVTAAFNKNLLRRINSELAGEFDLDQFQHRAIYNSSFERVEMHLVSQTDQRVEIGDAHVDFASGETIRTELSHKYRLESFAQMAAAAGFAQRQIWTDERDYFAVGFFEIAPN